MSNSTFRKFRGASTGRNSFSFEHLETGERENIQEYLAAGFQASGIQVTGFQITQKRESEIEIIAVVDPNDQRDNAHINVVKLILHAMPLEQLTQ